MAADAGNPRFDTTLTALIDSVQQVARALEAEPTIRRVLEAFASLPPDDRQTLATAIERGVAWRRVNESIEDAHGVRLRVNPNPRLFIRMIEGKEPVLPLSPDPEDVLVGILRLLRRTPILACDDARSVWEPATEEALGMLSPEERQSCLRVGRVVLALIEQVIARIDVACSGS